MTEPVGDSSQSDAAQPVSLTDLDQRIWREELEDFVPAQVFDAHTHIYRFEFCTAADRESGPYAQFIGKSFREAGWDLLDTVDRLLMPGRHVERLAFPFPFAGGTDFDASNDFIASQVGPHPDSGALMLVHPRMMSDDVRRVVRSHGFLGLKPYRFFSSTGDPVNCRLTDFLPEHQIAVANELGLAVMMHLSRPDGIADSANLDDLERLTELYPRVTWILAHCARSYSAWMIDRAGRRLRDLPNTWCDTSSVCESDAVAALLECIGPGRVMYGSDDVPVGALRGRYVAFGYGWAYLSETNHRLNLSHCDPRMTFTRYEGLRAMQRAARWLKLSRNDVEQMFHGNAVRMLSGVRGRITESSGVSSDL